MRSFRLTPAFLLLALGLGLGLTACEDFLGEGDEPLRELADRFTLPGDDVFPEGIAFNDDDNVFYVSSTTDGALYEVALDGDSAEVFSEGGADGRTTARGMAVDGNRLFVAGGPIGLAFAYDTDDGDSISVYETPDPPADGGTFINDVAVANGDAYFTDSFRPVLFRVEDEDQDSLEAWLDLTEDIPYGDGFNLNGIVATEDGDYLIVVQSNTGNLFRIYTDTTDVAEDEEIVMPIDVGGADLTNGDGLVLDGQMLYVVRNAQGEIVPVELSDDFLSGEADGAFPDEALLFPTTAAQISSRSLLVVNSQLNQRGGGGSPTLPFEVVRVRIPR